MDFQQAEKRFRQLKNQFESGTLSEPEFKTQLEELMVQDERGDWWMIGYETERWYRHDGKAWVQTDPPGSSSQKPKPILPTESEVTENKSLDKTDQDIVEKATREKAEPEEKAYIEKEGLLKPSWKRWIFSLIVLIISASVGFGVGRLICETTYCDIEPWFGAVPTWLLGIYLTYKVWKRFSSA
jgi:hypothetical protein